jgi:molecular chaperone GrpE (heat shock protein)
MLPDRMTKTKSKGGAILECALCALQAGLSPYPDRPMVEPLTPRLNKLPFIVGDVLLLALAGWLVLHVQPPLDVVRELLVVVCVALGAWLGVLPFLVEHRTQVRLAEAGGLASAVEQVQGLRTVGEQVSAATGRWQTVQESADRTARTAKEIADQISTEARSFSESMQKAHDAELKNLRLEVEKLHRAEGDWLQVTVRLLDHVYALYSAGVRSGQAGLAEELTRFQNACRDSARRIGLTPLEAANVPFDERIHQLPDESKPPEGSEVVETLATGYTYQGQLVRRVMVRLKPAAQAEPATGAGENQIAPAGQ